MTSCCCQTGATANFDKGRRSSRLHPALTRVALRVTFLRCPVAELAVPCLALTAAADGCSFVSCSSLVSPKQMEIWRCFHSLLPGGRSCVPRAGWPAQGGGCITLVVPWGRRSSLVTQCCCPC